MKRLYAFIAAILMCIAGFAQETEVVTVWGKAVDFISGEPLSRASVRVSGGNVGTVTNSEGVFSLKIPVAYADGILSVDFLGYSMWHTEVSSMVGSTEENPHRIGMMKTYFRIDSAVVRSIEPLELLKYAYTRVYYNYPNHREATTAFYRELIKKGSSKYLRLSEAVIDIDKASYSGFGTDKAAVYKGRTMSNYDQTDSVLINYQGGVNAALSLDQVHSPFAGVPWRYVDMFYDFRMEEPQNIGDRMFYVVSFDQKPTEKDMLCRGRVFIDTETYAIGRFEGWDNVEGRPYAYTEYIKEKPKDTQVAMKEVAWVMNYKESGGKWYLDYSSLSFQMNVRRAGKLLRNTYSIVSEMAVTDHYPGELEITGSARIRPRDQIAELVNDFTDEAFWGTYNIIEPDQSIEDAIRRIIRSLRRRR